MTEVCVCPHCGYNLKNISVVECGHLRIGNGEVRWKDRPIHLTPTQLCVVSALASSSGRILPHDCLISLAGLEDTGDPTNNLQVHIRRIRQKFMAVDETFNAIKSIWCVGLRWAA
jgi:DNA-binding response OmpR family regulator